MDLASHKFLSTPSLSPLNTPPLSLLPSPAAAAHSSHTSFPIIAVAVIGILATAFLLVSYYIFVIKCCLNWHRIDLLRRFSFSRRRAAAESPLVAYSPALANRGLTEAAIRSIPIFKFQNSDQNQNQNQNPDAKSCECAVCLSEFHQGEKLRAIPNCGHVFHIDCIDIWLQNNANCPLCRVSISATRPDPMYRPGPHPIDPDNRNADSFSGRDEDYVVIEIGSVTDPSLPRVDEDTTSSNGLLSISPSPRKTIEAKISRKKSKKFSRHASSMGDECIDNRHKDEQFVVQPIRRSFSMDSAADSQLYLAVQEIIQRHGNVNSSSSDEMNQTEGCSSSSRVKRSFFSFGQGRGSRNAVQPVSLEPR